MYKILFVGLLPLGQASFLSGLNNTVHYPMHILPGIYGRADYSDMFGFTQKEVEILLSKSTQNIEINELSSYYNGYQTSTGVCIYNPHSIMSSLKKGNVENYWANSGSANTIRECLKRCNRDIEIQLQNLFYTFYSLQDDDSLQRLVEMELKPHLRYDVLEKELEIDAIYTLLCYSGYLTVKTYSTDVELIVPNKQWGSTKVQLIIPNREVAEQWRQWIIEIIGVARVKTNDIHIQLAIQERH